MKEAWVILKEWSKEMVQAALENGADALVVPPGCQDRAKALGRIATVSEDGDLKPNRDVFFQTLHSPDDERQIEKLLAAGRVVIVKGDFSEGDSGRSLEVKSEAGGEDMHLPEGRPISNAIVALKGKVIPLENLTACGGRLLVEVQSLGDVELALGILEEGVSGVVIEAETPDELQAFLTRVKAVSEREILRTASVVAVRPAGLGDRVCVDTCTLMSEGEGLLVGNSSSFLFLVQAETRKNPYVAPRPFRVNAGPVHAYLRVPGGRTRYLSELRGGDPALVVNPEGATQQATVGRVKIERRPLLLIEAEFENARGSILLQNAETVRLTAPGGEAVSVVDLGPGDLVLAATEEAGRHFGKKVTETIWEK